MKRLYAIILLALFALGAQAQVRFEKTVDTVNDLQNLQPDDIHNVVFVKGYASAGAADGATFVYDSTSAAATNTVSVFKPTSVSGNGRWIRQDLMFQAGSATIPSITFGLDNNTGLANSASDQIDIITGGTRRGYVDSAGSLRLTSGVASSNTTTGTAIITGGLGLSGAFNAGGVANVTDTTEATTGGAGAIKTSGGIYSAKKIVGNTDLIVNTSLVYADSVASKVGINTTGPDAKLDVLDASGNEQIRTTYTDGSVYTKYRTLSDGSTLIQDSSGKTLNSTVVNNTAVSSRARQGGLAFDGVTDCKVLHAASSVGTNDFTVSGSFLFPSTVPANGCTIIGLSSSQSNLNVANALAILVDPSSGFTVYFFGTSDSLYRKRYIASTLTEFAGKVVHYAVVRNASASTLTVYLNGVSQTLSSSDTATPPAFSDSINSTYVIQGRYATSYYCNTTIYSAQLFTRALSASEVVDLANKGVSEGDKWASLTAAYTSDFSAGVDSFAALNGTVTGNVDGIGTPPQNDNLSFYADATLGSHAARRSTTVMQAGKRYRVKYSYFIPSTNTNVGGITSATSGGSNIGDSARAVLDAWTDVSFDTTTIASTTGIGFYAYNKSFSLSFSGANSPTNDLFYIRGITVTEIGCLLDADLAIGVGYQAPDRSSNHYDGLLSTTGVSHTREERRGQARFSLSADGYLGDTTSRACIPADARIESIVAYSTGTPTFTIGDDSGSAANIIAATILSASTVTDLGTPLKRFATTGTKGRIYIDFTAGAAATTFTVNYTTTGNY